MLGDESLLNKHTSQNLKNKVYEASNRKYNYIYYIVCPPQTVALLDQHIVHLVGHYVFKQ